MAYWLGTYVDKTQCNHTAKDLLQTCYIWTGMHNL